MLLIATYSVTVFYMIVYRSKLRLIGHHIYGSMSWFLWLEVIVSIANLSWVVIAGYFQQFLRYLVIPTDGEALEENLRSTELWPNNFDLRP